MKLDPHLPPLPSVGELLEHPRVKGMVARINRSTLAHRAAGFIEELRHSLSQRTGRVEIPTVTQLAERLARRLLGEPPAGGPMINATGVVVGHPQLAPPLADAAVQAMMQVASEYHERMSLRAGVESELCRLTGAEAALVLSSFDAALETAVAATCANREMLVIDRHGGDAARSIAWSKLAARHGAVQQTLGDDGKDLPALDAGDPPPAAVLRAPVAAAQPPSAELSERMRRKGGVLIDVAPMAGLIDPATFGLQSLATLRARLEKGVDLVIADGAGLLGGPACGIVIGKRQVVMQAANHALAKLASLDPGAAAALGATLATYSGEADAAFSIPVWQQLSAPLANLKQRAERIATLISASAGIESALAVETASPWCGLDPTSFTATTWMVSVRSRTAVDGVLASLQRQAYPIAANARDGAVHLDLRSVFPRWDQQLVTAFEGAGSSAEVTSAG